MKRFNFSLVAIALVLIVTAVSCTTMAGSQDDYYGQESRVYGNRVYVDDPYRGTVVLQRDPRTGRYYEISSYDPYYNNGYYGNRSTRGYRTYGTAYPSSRRNNGGYYNGSNSGNNQNANNNQNNERTSEQYKKNRDDARNKILGNSR